MAEFPIRTPEQLPVLLQSFRKASGLTQAQVAAQLGITQQTLSAMERNAGGVGAARLMLLLQVLGVELVLRDSGSGDNEAGAPPAAGSSSGW